MKEFIFLTLIGAWFGFVVGMVIFDSRPLESDERIVPDVEILISDGKADTTFIYRLED